MNTNMSDLDYFSKHEIMKLALNHKVKYKLRLGLSKKIKFGIEIEALGTDFINKLKDKRNVYYYSGNPAYKPSDIYGGSKWILYHEDTLYDECSSQVDSSSCMFCDSLINCEEPFRFSTCDGGEMASPILKDNIKCWKEIKHTINYMKSKVDNLRINESCSCHTHFDIGIFDNNPSLLYNFIILLAENEEILTRFYCGEFINLRSITEEWANPIKPLIKNAIINGVNTNSYKSLIRTIYRGYPKMKEYSFDFWEIYNDYFDYLSNTFENRIPNGTLSPVIIQNNIMLLGFLMQYVVEEKYDVERGRYNIVNNVIQDVLYVADMLPNDKLKLDFLSQYYKDGKIINSKKLVRSKRIFY